MTRINSRLKIGGAFAAILLGFTMLLAPAKADQLIWTEKNSDGTKVELYKSDDGSIWAIIYHKNGSYTIWNACEANPYNDLQNCLEGMDDCNRAPLSSKEQQEVAREGAPPGAAGLPRRCACLRSDAVQRQRAARRRSDFARQEGFELNPLRMAWMCSRTRQNHEMSCG